MFQGRPFHMYTSSSITVFRFLQQLEVLCSDRYRTHGGSSNSRKQLCGTSHPHSLCGDWDTISLGVMFCFSLARSSIGTLLKLLRKGQDPSPPNRAMSFVTHVSLPEVVQCRASFKHVSTTVSTYLPLPLRQENHRRHWDDFLLTLHFMRLEPLKPLPPRPPPCRYHPGGAGNADHSLLLECLEQPAHR